jgi:hypothetical protein
LATASATASAIEATTATIAAAGRLKPRVGLCRRRSASLFPWARSDLTTRATRTSGTRTERRPLACLWGVWRARGKRAKRSLWQAPYTRRTKRTTVSLQILLTLFLFARCISSAFSESYLTFFPPRHDRPPVPNTPQEGAPSPSPSPGPGPLHHPTAPGSRADFSGRRFHVVSRLRRKREQCVWQGQGQGQKGEAGPSR